MNKTGTIIYIKIERYKTDTIISSYKGQYTNITDKNVVIRDYKYNSNTLIDKNLINKIFFRNGSVKIGTNSIENLLDFNTQGYFIDCNIELAIESLINEYHKILNLHKVDYSDEKIKYNKCECGICMNDKLYDNYVILKDLNNL